MFLFIFAKIRCLPAFSFLPPLSSSSFRSLTLSRQSSPCSTLRLRLEDRDSLFTGCSSNLLLHIVTTCSPTLARSYSHSRNTSLPTIVRALHTRTSARHENRRNSRGYGPAPLENLFRNETGESEPRLAAPRRPESLPRCRVRR